MFKFNIYSNMSIDLFTAEDSKEKENQQFNATHTFSGLPKKMQSNGPKLHLKIWLYLWICIKSNLFLKIVFGWDKGMPFQASGFSIVFSISFFSFSFCYFCRSFDRLCSYRNIKEGRHSKLKVPVEGKVKFFFDFERKNAWI